MTTNTPKKPNDAPDVWDDHRITAYVLGELNEIDRTAFESEMEAHPKLAKAVQQARALTGELETLYASEQPPTLDAERRTAIAAAVAQEPVVNRPPSLRSSKRVVALIALAAGILLVVGVVPKWIAQSKVAMQNQDVFALDQDRGAASRSTIATSGAKSKSSPAHSETAMVLSKRRKRGRLEGGVLEAVVQETGVQEEASKVSVEKSVDPVAVVKAVERKSIPVVGDFAVAPMEAAAPAPATKPMPTPDMMSANPPSAMDSFEMSEVESMGTFRPKIGKKESMAEGMMMDDGALGASPAFGGSMEDKMRGQPTSNGLAMRKSKRASSMGKQPSGLGRRELQRQTALIDLDRRAVGGRFDSISENAFKVVDDHPLSTFSVDVDTASYSKVREYLTSYGQLPPSGAVRIEELINYFSYEDAPPTDDAEHPLACKIDLASCPWNPAHRLARIAINGKTMKPKDRPDCNLVFLIDTSGSMNSPNKLPLVVDGLKMLTRQLQPTDRVAIVVYASSTGRVLDSTPAKKRKKIRRALTRLSAGGSTNGGAGISLAYETVREHFINGGVNRVILCSDGDFNVGTTSTDQLVSMVEKEAKGNIFLTVLGFGMNNHNDDMMEKISGRGNGNYAFIDNRKEARKVLVEQAAGTLVTIAKDVKIQVEFNPAKVAGYRLIGYENRMLAKEDFNDDQKDAGEIGAGHSVTALYEWVPADVHSAALRPSVDELKYQDPQPQNAKPNETKPTSDEASQSSEVMTVKLRYKQPERDTSTRMEFPVEDRGTSFEDAADDLRFTAVVASFGMQLRGSKYAGDWKLRDVARVARSAMGSDKDELRAEFVELVDRAAELKGETSLPIAKPR